MRLPDDGTEPWVEQVRRNMVWIAGQMGRIVDYRRGDEELIRDLCSGYEFYLDFYADQEAREWDKWRNILGG